MISMIMPQQLSCAIVSGAPQCSIPYQTQKYFSITIYSGKQVSGTYLFRNAKTFGDNLYPQDNVAYQYCHDKNCGEFVWLTASIPLIQADTHNAHWVRINKKFEPYQCHSSLSENCPYTNLPYFKS